MENNTPARVSDTRAKMSVLSWLHTPPAPVIHEGRKIIRIGFQAYTPKGVPVQTKEEKNAKARERYERNIDAERFRKTKAGSKQARDAAGSGVRAADDGSVREGKCQLCGGGRQGNGEKLA